MIYLGLDLGKLRDFTAWAAVEENRYGELEVRYLERTAAMSRHAAMNGRCHLVMDGSGVGNPVEESLRAAQGGWRGLTAVSITGGDRARQASGYGVGERWNVPRRDLLSGVQVLLEKGKLKIAEGLPETRALVRELVRMRIGEGSSAEHDDLVMAVALGCWQAGRAKVGLGLRRVI